MDHEHVLDLDAGSGFVEPSPPFRACSFFLLSCAPMVALRRTVLRFYGAVFFALATPYSLTNR